jgi:hypothetical protein
MAKLEDFTVQHIVAANLHDLALSAWPHLPADYKLASSASLSVNVGGPVSPFSGETAAEAVTLLKEAAKRQAGASHTVLTASSLRMKALDTVLRHLDEAIGTSALLASNSVQSTKLHRTSSSKSLLQTNKVLERGRMSANWQDEITKQRPTDTLEAIEHLVKAHTEGTHLDAVVLTIGLCRIAKRLNAHHAAALDALSTVFEALASSDETLARGCLLAARVYPPRPQDIRRLFALVKSVAEAHGSSLADEAAKDARITVREVHQLSRDPSDKAWEEVINVPYATTVVLRTAELDGDVQPATLVAVDGTAAEVGFSKRHEARCGGGRLLLRGAVGSRLQLAAECEVDLSFSGTAAHEVKELAGSLCVTLARCITGGSTKERSISVDLGALLSGGITDAAVNDEKSDVLDATVAKIRCRKSSISGVRAFVRAVLHATDGTPEQIKELLGKASLNSEVVGNWSKKELQAVEFFCTRVIRPAPALSVAAASEAVMQHVTKMNIEEITQVVKERKMDAQRIMTALEALSLAATVLPEELMPTLHVPLHDLIEREDLLASFAGCGKATTEAVRTRISQLLGQLFQHIADVHDDDIAVTKPHHFVQQQRPHLGFALIMLSVAVTPGAAPFLRMQNLCSTILRFFTLPRDFTRSASYRIDSDAAESGVDASHHLERLAEGYTRVDRTPNHFTKTGTVNFKTDAVAFAASPWSFEIDTRASVKIFRVDTRNVNSNSLTVGVIPASRQTEFSTTTFTPTPGTALLDVEGNLTYVDAKGVICRCRIPALSHFIALHVAVQPSPSNARIGTVTFYGDGKVLCRVPLALTAAVVPVIANIAGSGDCKTSFGDATGVSLSERTQPRAIFPTAHAIATAACRTMFVLSHKFGQGSSFLIDAITADCEALVATLRPVVQDAPDDEVSKRNVARWIACTTLLGHLACLRQLVRSGAPDALAAVFDVMSRGLVMELDQDAGTAEIQYAILTLMGQIAEERSAQVVPSSELVEWLFVAAGSTDSSHHGKATSDSYMPKWLAEHAAKGLRCEESMVSFDNLAAEHLAAFAIPALPAVNQSAVSISLSRPADTLADFTFVGVGDIASSSQRLLGDYLGSLKDSKKRLYVVPANPDDAKHISSINAEELKRNRESWASPRHVFVPGDKITISINTAKRTILFARNGKSLGTLFSNVAVERLHPFVAMYSSDSTAQVEGVSASSMPSPTAVFARALLQQLCNHAGVRPVISANIDSKIDASDVAALRVLGSDGHALSVKLMPQGKPINIVGARLAATGSTEAVYHDDNGHLTSARWSSCAPQFAAKFTCDAEMLRVVTPKLVRVVDDLIAQDTAGVITVVRPSFVVRALRLLLQSDLDDLSGELRDVLVNKCRAFAPVRTSANSETDIIDKAWSDSLSAQEEFVTLQPETAEPTAEATASNRLVCPACEREWHSGVCRDARSPHPIPLTVAQSCQLAKREAITLAAGEWHCSNLRLRLSLDETHGCAVSGRGSCDIGSFAVTGSIVAGTCVNLRLVFEHAAPSKTHAPEDDGENDVWACEICTFLNPADASRCTMCSAGREGANWPCQACTYAYNSIELVTCTMCGTRRNPGRTETTVTAALTATCRSCASTKEVPDVYAFRANDRCSSCGTESWVLASPVIATFAGSVSELGDLIDGEMSIRSSTRAMQWTSPVYHALAANAKPGWFVPVGAPKPISTTVAAGRTKLPPLVDGICFAAKKVLLRSIRAGGQSTLAEGHLKLIAACLSSVTGPDHLQVLLEHVDPQQSDAVLSSVATALDRPTSESTLRTAMRLVSSFAESDRTLSPSTINQTLYAVTKAASATVSSDARRLAANAISSLLENRPQARAEIACRFINHPSIRKLTLVPSIVQAARGRILPNYDTTHTAAGLVLAAVDAMNREQPLPAIFDEDLTDELTHWVMLPQTSVTAEGHLVTGQLQGSVSARRSRKQKMYYEVEAPKNLRQVDLRMGWGTTAHARNAATYHVGSDGQSWAYNLKNMVMCFGGETEYTPPYFVKEGDVVGCALDLEASRCWWSINGYEMPPISIDGLVEDDEIFPFVSGALPADNPLRLYLTDTRYTPSGFSEFQNRLATTTLAPSKVPPRSLRFYKALNAILDEVTSSGVSLERLTAATRRPDESLGKQLTCILPSHENIRIDLSGDCDDGAAFLLAVGPYIRHLVTLSHVGRVATRVAHLVQDAPRIAELVQNIRYLTVLPARWAVLERIMDRRVVRSQTNVLKVEIDRTRALRSYTARNVVASSRADSVVAQLFAQTNAKDIFTHQRMFTVTFTGSIAEDGGGLYRSLMSIIADEIMGNALDEAADDTGGQAMRRRLSAAASAAGHEAVAEQRHIHRRTHLFTRNDHSTFMNAVPNTQATADEDIAMFTWLGKIIGNTVATGAAVLGVNFPRLFWKVLLNEPVTIEHYYHDCCDTVRGALQDDNLVLDDESFFEAVPNVRKHLSQPESRNDTERAAARRVAAEQALIHSYDVQLHAIRDGLATVVPREALTEMTWADLQRRVCGSQQFTPEELLDWLDVTLLDEAQVRILRTMIEAMSPEQRSKLLLFCSGQTRLPLPERIKVVCGDEPEKFPSAHTCSPITLTTQPYANAEVALQRFLVSMAHAYEYAFV